MHGLSLSDHCMFALITPREHKSMTDENWMQADFTNIGRPTPIQILDLHTILDWMCPFN